jgi:hypothetical protein
MAWWVIRVGREDMPHIMIQQSPYPTQKAAELGAWDNTRLWPQRPVDESVPPFIVEADDERQVVLQWVRQLGRRHPRQTSFSS